MVETNQTAAVSLMDLLALLVRKIKPIIICALVFALLLAGYQGYKQFSAPAVSVSDSDYADALEDYKIQKAAIESQIEKTQSLIDAQEKYNRESLLMQIDPGNAYSTTEYIAISPAGANDADAAADNYQSARIAKLYSTYWKTLDLSKVLSTEKTKDMPDQYVRDVVEISEITDGVIELKVIGNDAAETEKLADVVYSILANSKNIIEKDSYKHDFTLIGRSTICAADNDLNDLQQNNYNKISALTAALEAPKAQLASLSAPVLPGGRSTMAIAKWGVIGLVLGLFIACAWIVCAKMLNGSVLSSNHVRDNLGIEYLGKPASPATGIAKSADSISGEPSWKSLDIACQYVAQVGKLKLGDAKNVLVLSTLDVNETNGQVQALMRTLKNSGYSVKFVGNAVSNPIVLSELPACDSVILAEAVYATKIQNMSEIISKAGIANKSIAGFVLI